MQESDRKVTKRDFLRTISESWSMELVRQPRSAKSGEMGDPYKLSIGGMSFHALLG
jgi:hypothetical protein